MKSDSDWREKYLDAVDRLETIEKDWKSLDSAFRMLTSRLCLAAQGRDDQLDQELKRVSERVRRQGDAVELLELIDPLSRAIADLDPGPAPLASATTTQTNIKFTPAAPARSASADPMLTGLIAPDAARPNGSPSNTEDTQRVRSDTVAAALRQLSALPELAPALDSLQDKPASQVSADELATALQNLTSILGEQRSRLQREKLEVEGLLTQLNSRLEEIAVHLAGDVDRERSALDSSKQLDTFIMNEVLEMTTTVQSAADLGELRKQVNGRLDAIGQHFRAFRAREDERSRAQIERAEQMRARITELERESHVLQETLRREQRTALIDSLTGIPNRAAYDDRVDLDFRNWRATNAPISILAWDIDRFKTINDQFGHKAGDKVLRVVGQFLAQSVRATDFVGRYGGEEFVMILAETKIEQAIVVAEKIRVGISGLGFHFKNSPVTVTASCGITAFREGDSIDLAFNRADQALYRAKDEGRNRCVAN